MPARRKKPAAFGYPTVLDYTDKSILDYFDSMAAMSPRTVIAARDRLSLLPKFAKSQLGLTVDELVEQVKAGSTSSGVSNDLLQ